MKNLLIMSLMFGLLVACGDDDETFVHYVEVPVEVPPTPSPVDPVEQEIADLVAEENSYRLGLGQTAITPGLSCSVQQVSSGNRISSSSPSNLGPVISTTGTQYTYLYQGDFNMPDRGANSQNILIPEPVRPLFVGLNHVVRCSGFLVVRETGYYGFSLNSDDGSILTIDNEVVINNDGNHGMVLKNGTKFLRRGVVQFRLEYAQTGNGNMGLILTSGSSSIPSNLYFH